MRRPLCLVCLIFVLLIIGIVEIFPFEYGFSDIPSGETVLLEGKVTGKEIKKKNEQITYIIYLEQITSQSDSLEDNLGDKDSIIKKLNNAEGVLCYMAADSYVPNLGSYVQIKGELAAFEKADNPGEFYAPLYYKIKGIDFRMYDCRLIAYSDGYSSIREKLFRLKIKLCDIIDTCFSKEYSGIAKAILFAMNGELDTDTKELYQRNGMLHILCVSGLHISILGMGLYGLLKRLKVPEWLNTILCILMMLLYGVMIGMGTSVFRAILMFAMRLAAKLLHRTYDLLTAACVGIFCILMEQPLYVYHSGFLLSFLSVIALGAFRSVFPEKVCKVAFVNKRADSFFSGLTVWLVTLPVYGRYYYEVSVSGLLLNVVILPFVSVVLVLVIGVCVFGSLYLPLGAFVSKVCELFLWAFELIFEGFDRLGGTTLVLGYMPLYKCFIYFAGLTLLLFGMEKLKKRYLYLGLGILCAFLIVKMPKQLTITCLSVGQGDSAVVEYQDFVCVIDAGSSSENEVSKYTILPFLKYQGVREIDYLFLTHADSDHINGVKALLMQSRTGIRIKKLVVTDGENLGDYEEVMAVAKEYGVSVYEMQKGDLVTAEELKLWCLSPDESLLNKAAGSTNETSMVLLLEMEDFRMLFTGDAEGEGEKLVISALKDLKIPGVTVLKVAHHGSKNSTSGEFLAVAKPKIGIISCGENNSYGHPHTETLERLEDTGSRVLVTKDVGAVMIRVGKENITIKGMYGDETDEGKYSIY